MNVPSRDQTEEWRRQLYRAIEEFDRLSSELFGPTEVVYRIPHSNGLGVWIGVKSVHASQRLETVHRLIFGGFAEEARWTDDAGFEWVHFGFFSPSVRPEKVAEADSVRFVNVGRA